MRKWMRAALDVFMWLITLAILLVLFGPFFAAPWLR